MKKLGDYQAIDELNTKKLFLSYFEILNIPIIDYLAIGVQDNNKKISSSLMSNSEWQNTFRINDFAKHDPIRRTAFNTSCKIFTFDEIDCHDNYGKEIMKQRAKHYIQNGLVIMDRNLYFNYMLTLGTGYKNFNPYPFYFDNFIAINKIFSDLKKIISPLTTQYQIKNY